MTPKKAPLQRVYFLDVIGDTEYVENELTIDVAFKIVGEYSSWKVDIYQDGTRFKLSLTVLELAGDWNHLVEKLREHTKVYWRISNDYSPKMKCDDCNEYISLNNPLPQTDTESCSSDQNNSKVYQFLECIYDDIDWNDLYTIQDEITMKDTYLVMDKQNHLGILQVENKGSLYNIDNHEILDFWTDYFYDDITYSLDTLSLGQLLSLNVFNESVVKKLYDEFIIDKIDIVDSE
jgi:hypothetical protein